MSGFLTYLREQALKRDICSGKPGGLAECFARYGEKVYRYALYWLGNPDEAEEVVQEIFVRLAQHPEILRGVEKLSSYLVSSVRHQVIDFRRKEKNNLPLEAAGEFCSRDFLPEPPRKNLLQALNQLPPEQSEVLYLKVFQDLSFKEIGSLLTIPLNTAASRYRYAVKFLREKLEVAK